MRSYKICRKPAWRAFLNRSENNFITLRFADILTSIGAKAYLVFNDGRKSYHRTIQNNTGMSTDQDPILTFGRRQQTSAAQIIIKRADGRRRVIANPPINKVIAAASE